MAAIWYQPNSGGFCSIRNCSKAKDEIGWCRQAPSESHSSKAQGRTNQLHWSQQQHGQLPDSAALLGARHSTNMLRGTVPKTRDCHFTQKINNLSQSPEMNWHRAGEHEHRKCHDLLGLWLFTIRAANKIAHEVAGVNTKVTVTLCLRTFLCGLHLLLTSLRSCLLCSACSLPGAWSPDPAAGSGVPQADDLAHG